LSDLRTILGRIGPGVTLVAVSKFQDDSKIEALYREGQRIFGENYVQELVAKWERLRPSLPDIEFHFIGRLQRNKVKALIPAVRVIHSIDSLALLLEVDRRAREAGKRIGVYFQINIDSEPQKGGFVPEALPDLSDAVPGLSAIEPLGLMCIPDPERDPTEAFRRMKALSLRHGVVLGAGLSMGMSGDYELAVREGSTCVRIGSLLFGARTPPSERVSKGTN
jgi:pyridoxal phosphate enzyme (YggS family)